MIDATRVVGVVSSLLDPERKAELDVDEPRAAGDAPRPARRTREDAAAPLPQGDRASDADRVAARGRAHARRSPAPGWSSPRSPSSATFIDWTFFFTAWELKGRYPKILDHPKHGAAARELFDNAQRAAGRDRATASCCRRAACTASGPPTPRATTSCSTTAWCSRCSASRRPRATIGRTAASPTSSRRPRPGSATTSARSRSRRGSAPTTWSSASRPTTTTTARSWSKALADRLAEAFAEHLHQQARIAWGYQDAPLPNEELVAETYRGIRPAFGYPACPDHSQKRTLFDLLEAREIGIDLTDAFAMTPGRVGVGPVLRASRSRATSTSAASRRTSSRTTRAAGARASREAERWLRPNLAYDTD